MRTRPLLPASRLLLPGLVAIVALVAPVPSLSSTASDLALFSTSAAPNVVVLLDNSGSMDHIVWHPQFDPTVDPAGCSDWDNDDTYGIDSTHSDTACTRTRTIYHDPDSNGDTLYSGRYLNWYFDPANDTWANEIQTATGTRICDGSPYDRYQRNRMTAGKQVVLDTICHFDASRDIRVGLAIFREAEDSSSNDPNGAYLRVLAEDSSPAHTTALNAAISTTSAGGYTPLAESLFQLYTYFMERDGTKTPKGDDNSTLFPIYEYSTSTANGGGDDGAVIADPVQYHCQKAFVILITDGIPTRDDFDSDPNRTSHRFDNFDDLIGDYHTGDGETETGYSTEKTLYLDDVAKWMANNDSRLDHTGTQTVGVYTIGFATSGDTNLLLSKTAVNGNGLFFSSSSAEELTQALSGTITSIVEQNQSFSAGSVPASRTAAGNAFFTSTFKPSASRALWEGHVQAFTIDVAGDIWDKTPACALDDPDVGECNSGPFKPGALPWWDAADHVPAASSRKLLTSKLVASTPTRVDFDTGLDALDLSILPFAAAPDPAPNDIYPTSGAKNAEGLADEIVAYVRGCSYATGVAGPDFNADVTCVGRTPMLGDTFHSGPLVVARPRLSWPEASYVAFRQTYQYRDRVLYVGANDGFLHGIHAGDWDFAATPKRYDAGTGTELFGFMPWEPRQQIRKLPIDAPDTRRLYVDGTPQAADVWIGPTPTTATKASNGSEWKTVLVGGLREGGRHYYALDITNPAAAGYPGYLWEFPSENDPGSWLPKMGETWGQPIITKVRVKVDADDNGGPGYERWVAVVTGGFHASGDPNDHPNYDATATEGRAIMMIDIASGELLAAKALDGAASDAQVDMKYAIPSTPAVIDLQGDGFADIIYVGDLGGQVFKWVVAAVGEDRVNDSSVAGDTSQPSWDFSVFFEAPVTDIAGKNYYKSFFAPPSAAYNGPVLWLAFASGERANIGFAGLAGDENNRFYAMSDVDPKNVLGIDPSLDESDLTDVSGDPSCASISNRGYFFKGAEGEKFVTRTDIFAGLVLLASYTPPAVVDPCNQTGTGTLYVFSLACGEGYFDDGMGGPDRDMDLGVGLPTDPQASVGPDGEDSRIYVEMSDGSLKSFEAPPLDGRVQTLYWRMVE